MIKLFQPGTTAQQPYHYSTIRDNINVLNLSGTPDTGDFCACMQQCLPCLKIFTDEVGIDKYKNDFFQVYQNSVVGGSHKVFLIVEGEEIEVTDGTYGQIFNGSAFCGYRFDAFKIWDEHGYGEYSGKIINLDSVGNIVQTDETVCYKIEKYSDISANRTVRIETFQKGKLLHGKDYTNLAMLVGKNLPYWRQQIRLPGSFTLSGTPIEIDRLTLNDPERSSLQVMDKMTTEYEMNLYLLTSKQALPVILDNLFSAPCFVSDYSIFNFEKYRDVRVVRIEQGFNQRIAVRKNIKIKFKGEFENIEKSND